MSLKFFRTVCSLFLLMLLLQQGRAQGPETSHYYNPETELSWASCYLYNQDGTKQKIPFLPIVSGKFKRAPLGTNNFSKDVDVDSNIVFIGNGIVKKDTWNCYQKKKGKNISGEIDVIGKIVLLCYDFPDSTEEKVGKLVPLKNRIAEAKSRNARAVIVFSSKKEYPFLMVSYEKESEIPEVPAITITKKSVLEIFLNAGMDGESLFKTWEESRRPPLPVELSSKMNLKIKGNFNKVETENFIFRFFDEGISDEDKEKNIQTNEKALDIVLACFEKVKKLIWKKLLVVYFSDFASKVFYIHHWGFGYADLEGIFIRGFNLVLAVHEITHIVNYLNWGDSTSFMSEGVAKYTETLATNKDKNHLQTINFLKKNNLFPLQEMVKFDIGSEDFKKNLVAYSASGSFIGFLVDKYGLKSVMEAYVLEGRSSQDKEKENTWQKVYGKSLKNMEEEWLYWLAEQYNVDKEYILTHLKK